MEAAAVVSCLFVIWNRLSGARLKRGWLKQSRRVEWLKSFSIEKHETAKKLFLNLFRFLSHLKHLYVGVHPKSHQSLNWSWNQSFWCVRKLTSVKDWPIVASDLKSTISYLDLKSFWLWLKVQSLILIQNFYGCD